MKQHPTMGIPVGEPVHAPQFAPLNQSAVVGEFSTGLCDCFSDVSLCKSFYFLKNFDDLVNFNYSKWVVNYFQKKNNVNT